MPTPLDERTRVQNARNFENDMREIDERHRRRLAEIDATFRWRCTWIVVGLIVCLAGSAFWALIGGK